MDKIEIAIMNGEVSSMCRLSDEVSGITRAMKEYEPKVMVEASRRAERIEVAKSRQRMCLSSRDITMADMEETNLVWNLLRKCRRNGKLKY